MKNCRKKFIFFFLFKFVGYESPLSIAAI